MKATLSSQFISSNLNLYVRDLMDFAKVQKMFLTSKFRVLKSLFYSRFSVFQKHQYRLILLYKSKYQPVIDSTLYYLFK